MRYTDLIQCDKYYIYEDGTIKHKKTGKIKKVSYTSKGYQRSEFNFCTGRKRYLVHRLVAQHFISNPNNKPHVNHKDMNKRNNHATNLEWVTVYENNSHYSNSKESILKLIQYHEKAIRTLKAKL